MISNRIIRYISYFILLLILPALLSGCALSYSVIDGDTIKLQSGESIRYLGIDTPERGEPLFNEATELNRSLLEGKTIVLENDVTDKDIYGRLLRYVFADDIFVNLELVKRGLALAYSENEFQDNMYYLQFKEASDSAYESNLGIWALPFIHPKIEEDWEDYYIPGGYLNSQSDIVQPDEVLQ